MNRLLIALMTAVCCVFGNMNSFVYAEGETEENSAEIQETEQPAEEQITEETEETIQETETPPEETPAAEETAEVIPEEESLPDDAEPVTEEAEDTEVSVTEDEPEASLFTYVVNSGEATITGYTGSESDIVIPAYIEGYPVTEIGIHSLADLDVLESVVIPDTVRIIGHEGFFNCPNLRSVTIPDSVVFIGEDAFGKTWYVEEIHVESIKGWLPLKCSPRKAIRFSIPTVSSAQESCISEMNKLSI